MLRVVPPAAYPPRPHQWVLVDGEIRLRYTASFPAAPVWVVNHNMGFQPTSVQVRSDGGAVLDAQIQHQSLNQLRVYFDVPVSGAVDLA